MQEFAFTEVLPLAHDETPYRLVTTDGVSTFETLAGRFLRVEPAALTRITAEAMRDIAHLLRPGHLQQLRNILDDPEASGEALRHVLVGGVHSVEDFAKEVAEAEGGEPLPAHQATRIIGEVLAELDT